MKTFLLIAGVCGFLGVALGAFAAHGLKDRLDPYYLDVFQKGVQYQMYHTFALLAVALLMRIFPESGTLQASGWFFLAGIVIFSGSLYALSLSGVKILGAITPLGGICFLIGWALLVWQSFKIS